MAKKKQKIHKQSETKAKTVVSQEGLFFKIEAHLEKNKHIWGIGTVLLSLVLSLLMFNAKISIGNDDALYVEAAKEYADNFFTYFYVANAPFYTILMSFPIKIWGVNIVLLKLFSVGFFVLSIYFLYRAFINRIPHLILLLTLLLFSANWMALEYSSLTYTENLFLMLQALFLWLVNVLVERVMANSEDESLLDMFKKHWSLWVLLGVSFYFLYFTRTVGIGAIVVLPLAMLLFRRFKPLIIGTSSMLFFLGVFEMLKKVIWSKAPATSSNQSAMLFQKDPYDASQGVEDFAGFIERFWGNTQVYLSSRFWEILGFRDEPSEVIASLAIITIVPLIIGVIMAISRKQIYILLAGIYVSALLTITFFVLQVQWGQGRLVMVFLPLLAIVGMYFFYQLFSSKNLQGFQFVFVLMAAIFLFTGFKMTASKIKVNLPIAKANLLKGDKYAGYTDDWKNYLKLSEWCADSLPADAYVACRKAPMSFVYGKGKKFYGVYRGNEYADADSLINEFKKAKITHVIMANLRINPKSSQAGTINTVQRFVNPIAMKYPEAFEFVKQFGTDEVAVLYKFNFK
jgi:hypothetical protein